MSLFARSCVLSLLLERRVPHLLLELSNLGICTQCRHSTRSQPESCRCFPRGADSCDRTVECVTYLNASV